MSSIVRVFWVTPEKAEVSLHSLVPQLVLVTATIETLVSVEVVPMDVGSITEWGTSVLEVTTPTVLL